VHLGVFPSHLDYHLVSLLRTALVVTDAEKREVSSADEGNVTFLLRQPAQVDLRCFDLGLVSTSAGMVRAVVLSAFVCELWEGRNLDSCKDHSRAS
jgi:hypothetical protein